MSPSYHLYVGVDIAAKSFTATWAADPASAPKASSFDQTEDGFAALQQRLAATGVAPEASLVVMEATGNYWVALAVALHQARYTVSVLNPGQVARYARSLPRRAKTDALDAHVLIRFAAERQPPPWSPPAQVFHELRQRLVVRDGLVQRRTQAKNQRHAVQQWPVRIASALESLDTVIAELDEQVRSLEREIAEVLRDGAWASAATVLLATPGLGLVTTAWLLVATLNFTIAQSPEQLRAYAGLAPLARQSGTSVRGRAQIGHGGNGRLRTALYLATLSAARYNPSIKAFYERLRAAGKPMKVARCAAARKLLTLAWALVKKNEPYRAPQPAEPEQRAA
ncbi:MAG TPA: IS110 family transposase [Chloroflexaceae bacterium]|nr:IS110 family transposase [Chloroflexaceae bacterium]